MLSGVIFDLGSTLLRFDGQWPAVQARGHGVLLEKLLASGLTLDGTAFLSRYGEMTRAYYRERESEFIELTTARLLREALREFGHDALPDALVNEALDAMYQSTETEWSLMPGAHETLEALRRAGHRLGLVSNAADEANVQRLVDNARLRPYLDPIVVSAAVGVRKPNPRVFDHVLRAWGLPPESVAMVGDTLGADVLGARNAGLRSIWVTMQADSPSNLAHRETIVPDAVASSLSEIPAIIRQWESGGRAALRQLPHV